jgi:RimJ/RimL family protein N-acetyltransferase
MVIETARLFLRPIVADDSRSLMELFSDPIAMRHFPSTKDLSGTREWTREVQAREERDGYSFRLVVRKEDETVLGYCGLVLQKDVDGRDEVEVGYGLKRRYWHQGYASEAAAACLKYGFAELRLERIISLIRPENTASVSVAARNGLRFEKTVQRWDYLHNVYAINRMEFSEGPG